MAEHRPSGGLSSGAASLKLAELSVPDELLERIAVRVAELLAPVLAAPAASPWLTVGEAAEYLRCKPKRVYDLVSQRRISAHRDGSRLLFSRDELDGYVLADADTLLTPVANGLQTSGFSDGSRTGGPRSSAGKAA